MEVLCTMLLECHRLLHIRSFNDCLVLARQVEKGTYIPVSVCKIVDGKLKLQREIKLPPYCDRFFVFESVELKKPIIVSTRKNDISIFDFNDGSLLAEATAIHFHFKITIWKEQYVINNYNQVMFLQKTEQNAKIPYSIAWRGSYNPPRNCNCNMFCIGDKYFVLEYKDDNHFVRQFLVWNNNRKFWQKTDFKLEIPSDDIPITSMLYYKDRIIVGWKEKGEFLVFAMNGQLISEWCFPEAELFVWCNQLVAKQRFELTFLNHDGERIHSQLLLPVNYFQIFYHFWNRHLLIFSQSSPMKKPSLRFFGSRYALSTESYCEVSWWKTERLLWLAVMKNKGQSPLAQLPVELVRIIIRIIHEQPHDS